MKRATVILIILLAGGAVLVGVMASQGSLPYLSLGGTGKVEVSVLRIGYTASPTVSFSLANGYSSDLQEVTVDIEGNSFGPTLYLLHPGHSGAFTQSFSNLTIDSVEYTSLLSLHTYHVSITFTMADQSQQNYNKSCTTPAFNGSFKATPSLSVPATSSAVLSIDFKNTGNVPITQINWTLAYPGQGFLLPSVSYYEGEVNSTLSPGGSTQLGQDQGIFALNPGSSYSLTIIVTYYDGTQGNSTMVVTGHG
jgi:hypothetical protein